MQILQERRVGREPSHSQHDYELENHAATKLVHKQSGEGTSDTSEGESGRKNHQSTRWR